MNIFNKLTAAFAVVALLVGVVAYFAIMTTGNIDNEYRQIIDENVSVIETLEDLRFSGLRIVASVSEFGFIRAERQAAGHLAQQQQKEEIVEEDKIASGMASYNSAFRQYEELVTRFFPEEKELLEDIRNTGQALQEGAAALLQSKKDGASGLQVLELKEEFEKGEKAFLRAVNVVLAHEDEEISKRKKAVGAAVESGMRNIVMVGIIIFLVAIAVGFFISRSISRPIVRLRDATIEFGRGELGTRTDIKSKDEVGDLADSFNKMADRLQESQAALNNKWRSGPRNYRRPTGNWKGKSQSASWRRRRWPNTLRN